MSTLPLSFCTQKITVFVIQIVQVHVIFKLVYLINECYSSNYFRYLTSMQLVQFVLVFTHANVPLFHDCDFPKVFSWVILGHGALFFVLFSNFYVQSYMKKSSKKISSDPKITTNGAQTNGVQTNGDVKKEN